MSELDDSHDLQALRERVAAARAGLASTPLSKERGTGPPDPETGESWHRGNVLGHVNEMLDYWTAQIQRAIEGSGTIGRDEKGVAGRREGIDQGNAASEAELKRGIDERIGRVLVMLAAMTPDDLERDLPGPGAQRTVGSALLRVTYHGWFHLGEILAIRQVLGGTGLPEFAGNIDVEAPYRRG